MKTKKTKVNSKTQQPVVLDHNTTVIQATVKYQNIDSNDQVTDEGGICSLDDVIRRYWGPTVDDIRTAYQDLIDWKLLSQIQFIDNKTAYVSDYSLDNRLMYVIDHRNLVTCHTWDWYSEVLVTTKGKDEILYRLHGKENRKYMEKHYEKTDVV